MEKGVFAFFISSLLLGFGSAASLLTAFEKNEFCSWRSRFSNCRRNEFECDNGDCIRKSYYCGNGNHDCSDNSDEKYCYYDRPCPANFVSCQFSNRCIPDYFVCDGTSDCQNGEDEISCASKIAVGWESTLRWINEVKSSDYSTEAWGSQVDKAAVALYFAGKNFTEGSSERKRNLAYEVSIQFLSRLYRHKLEEIPSTDLASFVNAFLVTCLDPRKFHGLDIVQELRTRVDQQNYTNPYVLLTLCNAGDTITEADKSKLVNTFWNRQRPLWTDMQAFVVMALACANKQPGNDADSEQMNELTMELKQRQYRNGSVENLQTTALVMQALIASEFEKSPDDFDEQRAIEGILRHKKPDGSFGDLSSTYFVLPVLLCKSLVDINSDHCDSVQSDEISALEKLANRGGRKIRVKYSLWIGNEKDLERDIAIKVPANMSFYAVMELAAEIDTKFSFEYVVKNRKPYINAVSGFRDNPEKGKFWYLYTVKNGEPSPSKESPADIIPKENEHYVMWYRTGSWVD